MAIQLQVLHLFTVRPLWLTNNILRAKGYVSLKLGFAFPDFSSSPTCNFSCLVRIASVLIKQNQDITVYMMARLSSLRMYSILILVRFPDIAHIMTSQNIVSSSFIF